MLWVLLPFAARVCVCVGGGGGAGGGGQYSGENETRGTRREGCNVTKSNSRVAYFEVKVQVRDLVRDVGIVAPFPRGGQYSRRG